MKQTGFSISLSVLFLVVGTVLFYQSSNPTFISNADTVLGGAINVSKWLIILGTILILLAIAVALIQYLITTKKGK